MKKLFTLLIAFGVLISNGISCWRLIPIQGSADLQNNLALANTTVTNYEWNNNPVYFVDGKVKYYFYNNSSIDNDFSEANFNFILTPVGSTALVKGYLNSHYSTTSAFIMSWLNKNLTDFDDLWSLSYLNIIKSGEISLHWTNHVRFGVASDDSIYSDFSDNLGQPSAVLSGMADGYRAGSLLGQTAVRFHYDHYSFINDDFDVSFRSTIPATRVLW